MEEELSENELEERMYAMLHYVDETQANVSTNLKENNVLENAPTSTIRRYWRTSGDQNSIYQKINTPKEPATNKEVIDTTQSKAKDEKESPTNSSVDLSIFQQPVSQNVKKTIEILENEDENNVVELESSDEDEIIEVALPPKPTITIESSDEDDICTVSKDSPSKKILNKPAQDKPPGDREVTSSPVPSVVSSVSDEFIRSDCIALNISSKHPNNQSFDFSLHGSDLLGQTPSKKKKKKRNKDATSTPISTPATNTSTVPSIEECFATPKNKGKNKRQRTKSYQVSEKSIPNADVYDSDSNQSIIENNKNQSPYIVTDKSLPNTDVYESDSNQSEKNKPQNVAPASKDIESSDSSNPDIPVTETPKTPKKSTNEPLNKTVIVDLTEPDNVSINENIVMANVTGFTDIDDYCDDNISPTDVSKCGSTKIPAILNADLDFDNLKGNNKTCKRRRYSLTTLRAEMEKFYNESWGGEEFNHREIQKNMSRDKSLWVIDPKDRMPSSISKRKVTCNYCNRAGHRDDTCRMKPPICFMCGSAGHFEPRCPRKICVNCGSPNHMYSTMCRNCCNWSYIKCAECGQNGHPASHCPDIWRRYHNTINLESPMEESRQFKKHHQLFCSGCTRRGHLIHTCRLTLPFSGLPINSPYVAMYRPVYSQIHANQSVDSDNQQNKQTFKRNIQDNNSSSPIASSALARNEQLKRQSKSPVTHDTHQNKKRNLGLINDGESQQRTKSPSNNMQRKNSQSRDQPSTINKDSEPIATKNTKKPASESQATDKAPDFIPISSENHDKRGQIIQDNEVSDTSEVITSARVYITKEIVDKLKMDEGKIWLNETSKKNNITLENEDITFFLAIRGTVGNQEAFQSELREWIRTRHPSKERLASESEGDVTLESITDPNSLSNNIPKNRNNVLRKLNKAFDSLKKDLGDPKAMYKELVYLQNRHQQLLSQRVISPKQLSNNKDNINGMLRKLNMVLLGQAGLADGSKHMNELYSLQEKLTNLRQKNIPTTLRQEIGEHFHRIFAAIPRDDYTDLLGRYYNSKQKPAFKRKKYDKYFKVSPKTINKKSINMIQNFQKNVNTGVDARFENNENESSFIRGGATVNKTKSKLIFYHRRLLHSQTNDIVLKKTRSELMKKLHMSIGLMGNSDQMSSKDLKKMRKIQEQAQLFLTNV